MRDWRKRYGGTLLWTLGIAGAIHEIFFSKDDRPYTLGFIAGALGILGGIQIDRNRRKDDDK